MNSTLVDRLEKDDLVMTEHNDRDKRFVNIKLTNKGRAILTQTMPTARNIVNQVMLSTSEGHAALLEQLLRVLRQNANDALEHIARRS